MNSGSKILFITFAVFMVEAILHYNLGKNDVIKHQSSNGILPPANSLIKLAVIVGLFSVIYGSMLFINGATDIAKNFGLSETVIGITIEPQAEAS